MADDEMKIKFDLDAEGAISELQKVQSSLASLANGDNLLAMAANLTEMLGPIALVVAAIYTLKKAFDLTEEGESIERIEKAFDALSTTAGVSSSKMKDSLKAAAGGMVGMTDAMQMATKAMAELGLNSDKIPPLFELARKAGVLMGVDVKDAFNQITTAVATGHTRQLQHLGIIVDSAKAWRDYATANGLAVDELTQFQKQQAIANEVLAQGNEKFKNTGENAESVSIAMKKLYVDIKESFEELAKLTSQVLGPTFAKVVGFISETAKEWKNIFHDVGEMVKNDDQKKSEAAEKERARTQSLIQEKEAAGEREKQMALERQQESDKQLIHETKFAGDMNKINESINQDKLKLETDATQYHMERLNEMVLLDENYAIKEQELQNELNIKKTLTDEEYAEKSMALEEEKANKIRELNERSKNDEVAFQENRVKYAKSSSEGVSAAFSHGAAVADKNMHDFGMRGQQVFQAVNKSAVGFFKGLGAGSASASDLMKQAVFGALASMAQQQGEYLMAVGLGTMDPVAMAEGGALLALAGYLESQGGASASSSGSGGGGGGGGVSGAGGGIDIGIQPNAQQATGKAVSIQVQGSYFETEQTQRRLVDLVRQETDATSYTYSQVGVK